MDHMSCLSALGHTIVASIHQPRAGIWDMLHKVCSEPEIAKRMSLRLLCPSKADQLPEHHGPHVLPHSPGHTAVALNHQPRAAIWHMRHKVGGGCGTKCKVHIITSASRLSALGHTIVAFFHQPRAGIWACCTRWV